MNNETEPALRLQHIYDELRRVDFQVTKGSWSSALYHLETLVNLVDLARAESELERLREEKRNAEFSQHIRL